MIREFSGEYDFLSNSYPSPFKFLRTVFPTVQHSFEATKTMDGKIQRKIAKIGSVPRVIRYGKKIKTTPTWEQQKVQYMRELLEVKFTLYEELAEKLLKTGNEEIWYVNSYGDSFWGVCDGKGENVLGKLLMDVRGILRTNKVRDANKKSMKVVDNKERKNG